MCVLAMDIDSPSLADGMQTVGISLPLVHYFSWNSPPLPLTVRYGFQSPHHNNNNNLQASNLHECVCVCVCSLSSFVAVLMPRLASPHANVPPKQAFDKGTNAASWAQRCPRRLGFLQTNTNKTKHFSPFPE